MTLLKDQLVEAALNVLGSLVVRQKNVLEPVITPAKRFVITFVVPAAQLVYQELSYYRNQIIHLFINEGIIACGLYKHVKINPDAGILFLSQFAIHSFESC